MGFISKYILPDQVDFDTALQAQVHTTRSMIDALQKACSEGDKAALNAITTHAELARSLKTRNMKELLDVFITPYDKESIYRMITQLDWIVLSVKHMKLVIDAYGIESVNHYRDILDLLVTMIALLEEGVKQLATKDLKTIADDIEQVHDLYDDVVELCAQAAAEVLRQDDCRQIVMHHDLLAQLKEIAMRIHVAANTLEDMAIKVV